MVESIYIYIYTYVCAYEYIYSCIYAYLEEARVSKKVGPVVMEEVDEEALDVRAIRILCKTETAVTKEKTIPASHAAQPTSVAKPSVCSRAHGAL